MYSNYAPSAMAGGESAQSLAGQFNTQFSGSGGHAAAPPKKEGGGIFGAIKGFAKGFVNGAINTVKSLATPKGLLMAIGGAALIVATGGAATPFLIGAGVAMGGSKMVSSAAKGDWEGMGEGAFGVAASAAGARFGPKTFKGPAGETLAMAKPTGTGMLASAKNYGSTLMGKTKLVDATTGAPTSYSLGGVAKTNFVNNPTVQRVQSSASGLVSQGKTMAQSGWKSFQESGGFGNIKGQAQTQVANFRAGVSENGFAATAKTTGQQAWSSVRPKVQQIQSLLSKKMNGGLTASEETALATAQSEVAASGASTGFIGNFSAKASPFVQQGKQLAGTAFTKGREAAGYGYNWVKAHPGESAAVVGGGTGLGLLGQDPNQQQAYYA